MRSRLVLLAAAATAGAALLSYADADPVVTVVDTVAPQSDLYFGSRVSVGDWNGDGIPDVAISSQYDDTGGIDAGTVRIYSGDGWGEIFAFVGPQPGGICSGYLGYINGDAIADLAVGCPLEDVGGNIDQGRVYLVAGPGGTPICSFTTPNPQNGAGFGADLRVGDVNGDGLGDIAVSSHGETVAGKSLAGRAHAFSGATCSLMYSFESPAPAGGATFGQMVYIGDANLDGKGDIAVTAPYEAGWGTVYLFSGADGSLLCGPMTPSQPGAQLGQSVAMGDVNGDGRQDVVAGAQYETVAGMLSAGRVYAYSGASCGLLPSFPLSPPAPETSGEFGAGVWTGDIDSNGTTDVLAASLKADVSGVTNAGSTYAFSAGGALLSSFLPPNPQPYAFFGGGTVVSDLNLDAVNDVVIASTYEDVGLNQDQGRVYAFCLSEAHADGDGYSDCSEWHVGTDRVVRCGVGVLPQPSAAWPADLASGGIPDSTDRLNVLDLTSFLAPAPRHFGTSPGDAGYNVRWDITPGRGLFLTDINIQDLTSMLAGLSGFPPMLGGARAFNGPPCTDA